MHNNYYFLRKLSLRLEELLKGTVVSECYSQSKDELMIRFETTKGSFYIKASLSPAFACLSFPENHQRSRKNNIDLFPALIGLHIVKVRQFANERSFAFELTDGYTLLFKMHGNRSNILLFLNDDLADIFRKNIQVDSQIKLNELDRTIDFTKEFFLDHRDNLQSLYFTFGKPVWAYLERKRFSQSTVDQQWIMIQDVRSTLENPGLFSMTGSPEIALTILPVDHVLRKFTDPVEAITNFYYQYVQQQAFAKERQSFLSSLRNKIATSESFIKKNEAKLQEIERDNHYKIWADLIMANMHMIRQGDNKIIVQNFYDGNAPLEIKLKGDISPQKNAETYYRKAKNQHIEINRLKEVLAGKYIALDKLQEQIQQLEGAEDVRAVRKLQGLSDETEGKKKDITLPYHEFEFKGFRIWVGKDAQRNDELTMKYGFKEDLWLHAKDVPGSHVLIKHQANRPFPKDVIERAAELAAYNSKRKTETLCPVIVTPRKFVRKRKGDPAGAVVVEKESVVMVTPKLS